MHINIAILTDQIQSKTLSVSFTKPTFCCLGVFFFHFFFEKLSSFVNMTDFLLSEDMVIADNYVIFLVKGKVVLYPSLDLAAKEEKLK